MLKFCQVFSLKKFYRNFCNIVFFHFTEECNCKIFLDVSLMNEFLYNNTLILIAVLTTNNIQCAKCNKGINVKTTFVCFPIQFLNQNIDVILKNTYKLPQYGEMKGWCGEFPSLLPFCSWGNKTNFRSNL